MKKLSVLLLFIFNFSLITFLSAQTGTWTALTNLAPDYNFGVMLLMTDGTVICHNATGGQYGTGWDRLTPDATGSYANGTWSTIASMNDDRIAFSAQVLPSGKVWVAGGEYGPGGYTAEIYDPAADTWTYCTGVPSGWNIYDAPSELLYDGTVLCGPEIGNNPSNDCMYYNPTTNACSIAPTALLNHDEAQWLKLPDSSVLFIGIGSESSNRFIPQTGNWINDANVPVPVYDQFGFESGPAFMLPNGNAIFFGAAQFNAFYYPSGNQNPGGFAGAANFPMINGTQVGMPDAPGAMMPNGHILLAVSPIGTSQGDEFRTPTYFLEYNYATNTFTQVTSNIPTIGTDSIAGCISQQWNFLDLPDGTVLAGIDQANNSNQYFIYTPGSGPIPQGKPTINSILPDACPSYKITGKLFNGITEGAAFGDDWQMATNYPIVRLSNGSNVYYARTGNWNRIGAVQTDSLEDTCIFTVPSMPGGTYSLVVVANGNPSNPVLFTVFGSELTSQTNVICNGSSTGSAIIFAAGGITPYTYSWSPTGGSNASASNLSAGTYTVTSTDNNGCSTTLSFTITQPTAVSVSANTTNNVLCHGQSNGGVSSAASGGSFPYTYSWSGGGGTNTTASSLSAGTYIITVHDSCGNSATASATVNQPAQLALVTYSADATDSGCNGQAAIIPGGGTAPYSYLWSTAGQTTDTIKGQCPGNYCCVVTDNHGCSQSTCVDVISGIQNIESGNGGIWVYPNPSNGVFTIQSSVNSGLSSVEIYNVLGEKIYSNTVTIIHGSNIEINISTNPNGIYLYRITKENGEEISVGKIIIQE